MLGFLAANPKKPSPCRPAQRPYLSRGLHLPMGSLTPRWSRGRTVLRTQSGPATLSSQGALLPRGSVLTPWSPGCSLGGATGTGHGSGVHRGHDKEPFSSGTSRHSEPPSAHGTRLPHSRPSQWPAVRLQCGPNCSPVWAHSGARAGLVQTKRGARSFCPRGERSLEPCREGEGDQAPWYLQGSHRPSHRVRASGSRS